METITELLRKIVGAAGGNLSDSIWIGKVVSVDKSERTCVVEDMNELKHEDVRLQANIKGTGGLLLIPKQNTDVIVNKISETNEYVDLVFETEEVIINGDQYGGLIKIEELRKQINKNSAIIDALLNILKGRAIPEPGNGSPSALQTALKAVITGKSTANLNDIENEKVKHG